MRKCVNPDCVICSVTDDILDDEHGCIPDDEQVTFEFTDKGVERLSEPFTPPHTGVVGITEWPSLPARAVAGFCTLPPPGWVCSRVVGHEGPCAAYPHTANAAVGGERAN